MLDLIVHLGRAASSGFITHYAMGGLLGADLTHNRPQCVSRGRIVSETNVINLSAAYENTNGQHEDTAKNDLENRVEKWRIHVTGADKCDCP
jgi:hypothetical protein